MSALDIPIKPARMACIQSVLDRGPLFSDAISMKAVFNHGFVPDPTKSDGENLAAFRAHQNQFVNQPMKPTGAFDWVRFTSHPLFSQPLPGLNHPLVVHHLATRQEYMGAERFENSLEHFGIPYLTSQFLAGDKPLNAAAAVGAKVYFTGDDSYNEAEMNTAGIPPLFELPGHKINPEVFFDQFALFFDWDACVADGRSEIIYQLFGLDVFEANERINRANSMEYGPLARLFFSSLLLRSLFSEEKNSSPILLGIISARGGDALKRVRQTIAEWTVRNQFPEVPLDYVVGSAGRNKGQLMQAYLLARRERVRAKLFDDYRGHAETAVAHGFAASVVPSEARKVEPLRSVG